MPLAAEAVKYLDEGMLYLADRHFFGFDLWQQARAGGAVLLWRVKKNLLLPCVKRLPDGSYLSKIYPSLRDRRHDTNAVGVRVVEYQLEEVADSESIYRLVATILDPDKAPADELAALYQERWEIENAFDELKTHLRGSGKVLRSKKPDLVRQEFYGLILAHFAIRGLMHEATLEHKKDPDELSFTHAVRVIRRKLPMFNAFPPEKRKLLHEAMLRKLVDHQLGCSRGHRNPRAVKRAATKFPVRHHCQKLLDIDFNTCIKVLK